MSENQAVLFTPKHGDIDAVSSCQGVVLRVAMGFGAEGVIIRDFSSGREFMALNDEVSVIPSST